MLEPEQRKEDVKLIRDQLLRVFSIFRRSFRHVGKAALLVCMGGAVSVGLAVAKKRIYYSESVILYRRLISDNYLGGAGGQSSSAENVGMRLREVLLARPRLQNIIKQFDLYKPTVDTAGYVEAVNTMRNNIDFRVGGGDTFHVAFFGPDPKTTQNVTRKLAESLIEEEQKSRTLAANATVGFLNVEHKRINESLRRCETNLAEFLALHPEFAQENVAGIGPQGSSAGAAVRARRQLQRKSDPTLLALNRQKDRLKQMMRSGSTGRVVRDPKIMARQREAETAVQDANRDLAQARTKYTELFPAVVSAKQRLKAAKQRLEQIKRAAALSTRVEGGTKINKEALNRKAKAIDAEISKYRGRKSKARQTSTAITIVDLETQWTRLNREVQEAREHYLRIDTRVFRAQLEATASIGGQVAQLEIIDPAYEPMRPAGMGRTMTVAAGLAVFMFLGIVVMLGLALVDDRVYNRLDVQRLGVGEVLIEVPRPYKWWQLGKRLAARKAIAKAEAKARKRRKRRG